MLSTSLIQLHDTDIADEGLDVLVLAVHLFEQCGGVLLTGSIGPYDAGLRRAGLRERAAHSILVGRSPVIREICPRTGSAEGQSRGEANAHGATGYDDSLVGEIVPHGL